ncbi:MAG TPA: patatin-like phospholipase family protein [Thermoanaerobaculia bacterium]
MTLAFAPPPGDADPRRSLVLAGGGIRVAYQAGVLRALDEAGLRFAHADGTSGGTINLAMLFSGLSPVEMCDRWRTLDVHGFASLVPLEQYLRSWDMMALGDADGMVGKVFPHLGIDLEKIRAATGMAGTFNVCNFTRKTNEAIPHDRLDLDFLVAGASLPIFFPPVRKGDTSYCDSVWIKDANLMEAVRRGAEEIWLVWCIGNSATYHPGAFRQYVHMIEISANGALFEEFDRLRELNERIARGDSPFGQRGPIRLHVVKPEHPLPLDPDYFLGRIDGATLIALGYRDACAYLAGRTEEGVPFEPEVTQMVDSPPGITFRETVAGGFALGATEPREGEQAGDRDGTRLTMSAGVLIRDLDGFLADPGHTGELVGHVTFPPLGENLPARSGTFNLFSPADRPDTKWMVYELGFTVGGKDYYLAGRKEVRDDPGLDMWKDVTTLFTVLHEGRDKSGPVVGAGVLSLNLIRLMKLVPTMTVTNAKSMGEKAAALAKFGRFFAAEVYDTFVKGPPSGAG